jgi:hypothetical protein
VNSIRRKNGQLQSEPHPRDLRSLFPTRWLNATAREVGLVERRRKVAPAAFFWTLVLGFAVGHRPSIASLRRFYWATTGTSLVPSSIYDWFNAATVRFLKRALARANDRLAEPSGQLSENLARFKDLCVADATVIRMRDALAWTSRWKTAPQRHVLVTSSTPTRLSANSWRGREDTACRSSTPAGGPH